MPELDDEDRAYLAAFLEVHTPSEAATDAALGKVQERLTAGEVITLPGAAGEPGRIPSRVRPLLVLGAAVVAIAAAVALLMRLDVTTMLASETPGASPEEAVYAGQESGGAEGEAVRRVRTSSSARSKARASSAVAEEPGLEEPEVEEEPVIEEPVIEPEVEATSERRRPRPAPRSAEEPASEAPPKPAADATLHAEIALLRPAQKALRSGNYVRALRLLDDHAKSFPRSVLAEERTLGRITAVCGLGRIQEAQRMIDAFGRAHPGSPLAGRVDEACSSREAP